MIKILILNQTLICKLIYKNLQIKFFFNIKKNHISKIINKKNMKYNIDPIMRMIN